MATPSMGHIGRDMLTSPVGVSKRVWSSARASWPCSESVLQYTVALPAPKISFPIPELPSSKDGICSSMKTDIWAFFPQGKRNVLPTKCLANEAIKDGHMKKRDMQGLQLHSACIAARL